MRSRLTEKEAKCVAIALYKAEKFDLTSLKELILSFLAVKCSVNGLGRKDLLQAVTGMVMPAWGRRGAEKKGDGQG